MICSSCQANNPDQAKFCMQCGAAQANTCPPCSTELPPEARFCFGCGHQIRGSVDASSGRFNPGCAS